MTLPSHPYLQFSHRLGQDPLPTSDGPQMVYGLLEIAVQGENNPAVGLPLNLCLVLDQSLSMKGEKMERVAEAARYVFSQLSPRDVLSIVSFNDRATVVLPAELSPLPSAFNKALDSIVPRGGTEMAAGIRTGLEELLHGRNRVGRAISSLLLLTDGRTYGDESRCMDLADLAHRHELLITPLGVGEEWNEDLLEAIAFRCGSHSVYIDRTAAIVDAFRQHILELRSICGRQAHLTLRTNEGTRLAQIHRVAPLIGRIELLPSPNISEQTYALGNLMLGDPQSLLLEIVLPQIGPGVVDIASCTLEWQPTDSSLGSERAEYTMRATVSRLARPAQALNEQVKVAVEKVVAYKLQKRAWQDLQDGNLTQATTKLRMVATRLLAAGEPELARTVQDEADHLERHGFASVVGTKQIKYGTRGLGRTRSMRAPEQARS